MRKHMPTIIFLAIMFMAGAAIFLLGAKWSDNIHKESAENHRIHMEALKSQHVFCKECCWKTKYLYTCAETKKGLWRYTP